MKDFPYLYRNSRTEARRLKETREHEDSFRLNVSCARAIEQSIRDHFSEAEEGLAEGCAQSVLERYGFLRVDFVLANSLKQMGSPQRIGEEERQWLQETYVPPDGKYNRYFAVDTAASLLEAFIRQTKEAYQALGLFGPEHCVPGSDKQDYIGKVLAVSPNSLKESCWDPRNQLWLFADIPGAGCFCHLSGRRRAGPLGPQQLYRHCKRGAPAGLGTGKAPGAAQLPAEANQRSQHLVEKYEEEIT